MRVNSQTESMFGYTSMELCGQRIEILMPTRFKVQHEHHRTHYMAKPQLRLMGAGLDLYGRRKNGTEFPVDIMLSPIETPEGQGVIATIRDITERVQAEEALRKSHEEQALLAERTAAVACAPDALMAAKGHFRIKSACVRGSRSQNTAG